ncbi:Ig-like domain-containing protein [Paenibacillus sp. BR1-192]|uniref:Ig-like domain-containing protein n=1 Tax=Paenibacillus sp. BR1-192 TaxID=3032287 RepID=UPI00240D81B0|nr:Ig-like domain-containing protein [Paenibacillus sp. BR1-192]WFB58185.1 S-layer homology domain-containing protein [Paenibacillus sp. BR1-192]
MSDKSYQIKENNQVMIQGGEKKVMKKILSVALSTAMAFSMFASVAFGDDALNTQQKFDVLKEKGIFTGYPDGTAGLDKEMTRAEFAKVLVGIMGLEPIEGKASFKDKNYKADKWPAPYVEAVYAAGLMEGKNTTKMIFDFNGKITVQEMAKVLVTAQKLEIPTETNNNASDWAKGYVQAAINAGLVDAKANPKANASRSQLVDVAYSIYLAQQKPAVVSYKVSEEGKVVEFTLANNEVVKVTLETALKANVAQDVKFTHNNYEYTHNVTWVVTVATKIDSVSASNLKEIVVKFDGTVDRASASNEDNYTVKGELDIEEAVVADDNKSVTLLLNAGDSNRLVNQVETELTVKNVKNEDKSKTFEQTIKFTPVDVAIPEVKEVVALGTGAFKVEFSEPVKQAGAIITNNYRIDGKVIGATVEYQYPNIAIVSTPLAVGEHKLTVSNVEDYSGLKVAPVEKTFTVVEDTEAPTVASIKTNDLREITIEFNETVKSVDKVYANTTGNTGTIGKPRDNKVTVTFANPLNLNENTIYIEGVADYSGNKANRDAKVNPTLDTERPTVVKAQLKQQKNNTNHELVIEFSENVDAPSAQTRANYVLKDKDGKPAKAVGLDNNGKPVLAPVYNANSRTVTIDLASKLDNGTYTLEVSGVKDRAYVPNQMLPFTTTVDSNVASEGRVQRVWQVDSTTSNESYIFVQFNKTLATSGVGDATAKAKYKVNGVNLDSDDNVILYTPDTVRISVAPKVTAANVTINLVSDVDGKFITNAAGDYVFTETVGLAAVGLKANEDVVAESNETVKLVFAGPLSYVNVSDFRVTANGSTYYDPTSYTLSADKTTLTLNFANKLPADLQGYKIYTGQTPSTQDSFGTRIAQINGVTVVDKVAPEAKEEGFHIKTATGATYDIEIITTETVSTNSAAVTDAFVKGLFTVKIGGNDAVVNTVAYSANKITLNVTPKAGTTPAATDVVSVVFDGAANSGAKAVVDWNKNALKTINLAAQYQNID